MTDASQQTLLCSYFLALLLLPFASSCESTKPMAEVKRDYLYSIHPLLQNIENNITNVLGDQTKCGEIKKKYTCEMNNETRSIHRMVCSIRFKKAKKVMRKIQCDIRKLTVDITDSLECNCSRTEENPSRLNCTRPHRRNLSTERLCKLQSIIRDIKSCYIVLTEKDS
ncbi:hypothetical protein GJAV_G00079000 [Gymnothorax javanicus]|nr:hypothetical protein GJAV_G00079000 [Gymnothorax javanicus]